MLLPQTIKGAIAEYLECVTALKSESSKEIERYFFRDFENFFMSKNIIYLSDVSSRHAESLQAHLLKNKKASTINRQFTVYKHFFGKCKVWRFLKKNPFVHVKKIREIDPQIKTITKKEIDKLINSSEGWFKDALVFLSTTGSRPDELRNLKSKDIDLERMSLNLFCLKNKDGFRVIPFNKKYYSFFERLKKSKKPDDFIFYTEAGNRVMTDVLTKKLKRLCEKKRMYKYSIYSLRHTYLTNLAKNNHNLESIRKLAGHQKISTTQKYVHIDFSELQKVVNSV